MRNVDVDAGGETAGGTGAGGDGAAGCPAAERGARTIALASAPSAFNKLRRARIGLILASSNTQ
jgi:hypothetical protein